LIRHRLPLSLGGIPHFLKASGLLSIHQLLVVCRELLHQDLLVVNGGGNPGLVGSELFEFLSKELWLNARTLLVQNQEVGDVVLLCLLFHNQEY
jgi:hypothetical protein